MKTDRGLLTMTIFYQLLSTFRFKMIDDIVKLVSMTNVSSESEFLISLCNILYLNVIAWYFQLFNQVKSI